MGRGPFNGRSGDADCVTFPPDTSWSNDKMIRFLELYTRKERSAIVEETLIVSAKSSLVKDRGNGLFTDGCKRDKDGWLVGWLATKTSCFGLRHTTHMCTQKTEIVTRRRILSSVVHYY